MEKLVAGKLTFHEEASSTVCDIRQKPTNLSYTPSSQTESASKGCGSREFSLCPRELGHGRCPLRLQQTTFRSFEPSKSPGRWDAVDFGEGQLQLQGIEKLE
jgi:hypothetical protein